MNYNYENIKKNYSNTKEKPIKFHEKAKIVNLDVGSIKETKVSIDFPTFAAIEIKKKGVN